jgi:hypothetical protein
MNMQPGVFKHFKGGRYRVILSAMDSETQAPMTVYVSLTNGSVWVRPTEMFTEAVQWPDGAWRSRFVPETE